MNLIALGVDARELARVNRNDAVHAMLEPSRSGRAKGRVRLVQPDACRQVAECRRRLGPEPCPPTRPETEIRPPDTAPQPEVLDLLVGIEPENRPARDDSDLGTG